MGTSVRSTASRLRSALAGDGGPEGRKRTEGGPERRAPAGEEGEDEISGAGVGGALGRPRSQVPARHHSSGSALFSDGSLWGPRISEQPSPARVPPAA